MYNELIYVEIEPWAQVSEKLREKSRAIQLLSINYPNCADDQNETDKMKNI